MHDSKLPYMDILD